MNISDRTAKAALICIFSLLLAIVAYAGYVIFFSMNAQTVLRRLSGLRMSAELYRNEKKTYPDSPETLIIHGSLEAFPELKLKRHFPSSKVVQTEDIVVNDSGKWAYVSNPKSRNFGVFYIDCSHKDEKGRDWSWF